MYSGQESSRHCILRKHMQIDNTKAVNIFINLTTDMQHLGNTANNHNITKCTNTVQFPQHIKKIFTLLKDKQQKYFPRTL